MGVYQSRRNCRSQEISLEELQRLAETAGARVTATRLQELRSPHPATFIGKGTMESIAEEVASRGHPLVIFDEDLTPVQNRNLEKILQVKVIDRTGLILDIFARRARTREGKIQVELAQLRYLLPRLAGRGAEFSQLAGGIGTRGPGETRLEMDRRKAKVRIGRLQGELTKIRAHRALHRSRRERVPMALVAIVGYTNAGKSTLMNRLTDAGVLVEDKLFATLDPTVRRLRLPSGREILFADTVGFVRKLPHQLIDAFRATFEEVAAADLLIHLIDISHPEAIEQSKVVSQVLEELGLHRKPVIRVFSKADQDGSPPPIAPSLSNGDLFISALTGQGIGELLATLEEKLSRSFYHLSLCLPHEAGSELSLLYRTGRVLKREDRPDGIHLQVEVDEKNFNKFRHYHS